MENEEIDIMELVRKVLKEWKFIAFWCFVAAVIGVVVVLSTPRKYAVNMILAPEIAKKGVSGNLSALAGMAGINLGGLNSSSRYRVLHSLHCGNVLHSRGVQQKKGSGGNGCV